MSRLRSFSPAAGLALLLALFAARLADTANSHSLTADEPHYVGTGLYLWKSGDYHFARTLNLHPPLAYHLASLPLLAFDLRGVPVARDVGARLVAGPEPSPRAVRLASRLPFALLSLWGAALCFAWAREVAGDAAGLLAAFLYTFSPMLLAHGALAHSDVTVTVFYLQTLYALWRWTRRPGPGRALACGVSLGLALLSKLSAMLLLGMVPLLLAGHAAGWLPAGATPRGPARAAWLRSALAGAGLLAVAGAVLWAGYGGSFASVRLPEGPLAGVPVPGYLASVLVDQRINEVGRETYFWGHFSDRGPWYVFPAAFAVKTPVGILALVVFALATAVRGPAPLGRFLTVPFAVFLGVACFWLDIPLGLRYLLPLYPLLFVFVATQLAPVVGSPARRGARVIVAACCAWLAVASLAAHPHYLAYFNEPAGGPARGHRYLLDGNLDWGQDLPALASWLASRGNPVVKLAYFGPESPARYGIRSAPLRGCAPVSGRIAISANVRYGLYAAHNPMAPAVRDCYAWLDAYEPVASPGHSILVYEIPDS